MSGWLPFWEAVPGRDAGKDKVSLEEVGLTATARTGKGAAKLTTGLVVEHITACPCVQLTLRHARADGDGPDPGPLMTQSKRCRTHVQFSHHENELPLAEVLRAVDGVVFRTQNTLPREHELNLVDRAHDRPQFIEDVARGLLCRLRPGRRGRPPELPDRRGLDEHGVDPQLRYLRQRLGRGPTTRAGSTWRRSSTGSRVWGLGTSCSKGGVS